MLNDSANGFLICILVVRAEGSERGDDVGGEDWGFL